VRIHAVPIGNGNHTVVLLLFPVNTGLFLPVEIVNILAFKFHSQITLMHVHGNDCFDFLSFNTGRHFFQTHSGEQFHHLLNFPSLRFQRSFLIFTRSFQSFGNLLSPYSLNSDQGHLGWISSNKFSHLRDSGVGADFTCFTNNIFHCLLHFLLETTKPSFN
jgi:hypothetical protein